MASRRNFGCDGKMSTYKKRDKNRDKHKKYIGNIGEGQGFADKRKKKIQYEYMKLMRKEKQKQPSTSSEPHTSLDPDMSPTASSSTGYRKKVDRTERKMFGKNAFSKASEENKARKELKFKKKQEALKRKAEREASLENYQKKKKENFKKICKKTHKGQPVMKNQIEYLLQKIEKQVNQT